VEPTIFPERVKAVFDHRELVFTAKFINAEIKIEKVGSCATLMTELFSKGRKIPSQKTAVWLYSAIISNTVNFKNTVTTQRDIEAATWLRPMAKVDRDYVRKMFEYKSRIRNEKELRFLIDQDFSTKELYGKKVGIAQIEIAKLEKMLASYNTVIRKVLKEYLAGESLDYVLFTGVDIVEGFNVFMVADKKSGAFFSKVLGISNVGGKFKRRGIIMRKQIWPKIEVVLKRMVQ
jgi:inorganic pyrophosphatase/exopolyphosphatase